MHDIIVNTAEQIRQKYKFEIDSCLNELGFWKAKLFNDKQNTTKIIKAIYKIK